MRKLGQEEFIERVNKVHNFKYDYTKTIYTHKRNKITITCPIHGDFEQLAANHMRGQGCPQCGKLYASTWRKNDYNHFLKESEKRFGDEYEFPCIKDEYQNSHSKITIRCKKCGNVFIKIACDHLTSRIGGCVKCSNGTSNAETCLGDYITSLLPSTQVYKNDRNLLHGKEIDILIPDLKIGIEYNGLYWHNADRKGKTAHLEKLEACKTLGYKLIQIFEDEYCSNQVIVEHKLLHLLGLDKSLPKVYGRKCHIKLINKEIAKEFLQQYHIQGYVPSTFYYGAYFNDTLVAVMSFKQNTKQGKDWELTRFASDYNYLCCGIGGKLFKHFIKEHNPDLIKSFADRRWTVDEENNIYCQLGFKFDGYTLPDYKYMISSAAKRYHKFGFRKKILLSKYPDKLTADMTEREMCDKINAYRIYDCGLIRYIWKKEN